MARDPHESLDDFLRRQRKTRRGTQSTGDRIINIALPVVVIGSAILAIYHAGWVRFGLLGIVPAFALLGLCSVLYKMRPLRIIVAPVGALILLGFPAFWTDSIVYALTASWTLSTGLAVVVLLVTMPGLVAWQRWARRRKRNRHPLEDDAAL